MTANRISMSLFDAELKTLINASAKIFPITQQDVDNNRNPNGYEYGKVDRSVYMWKNNAWGYIVADDANIDWEDVKNKPAVYKPAEHDHAQLHDHLNKTALDIITQLLIAKWNDAALHVSDLVRHITAEERTLWNTVAGKAPVLHDHNNLYYTETEVNTLLANKAAATHNHDGSYYLKSAVDALLADKAAAIHNHTTYEDELADLDTRIYLIEGGYTEGHVHEDITLLESLTQAMLDDWNNAVAHISDLVKHVTAAERIKWNTVDNKTDVGHKHVISDVTGLEDFDPVVTWDDVQNKPLAFPAVPHNHDDKYFTETEVTALLAGKAEATTLSGHIGSTAVHVTQSDKDKWNAGGNAVTIGGVKPTDHSLWFKKK